MNKEKKATDISVAATAMLCVAIVSLLTISGGLAWWFLKANHVLQWTVISEIAMVCIILWGLILSMMMLAFIAFRLLIKDKVDGQKLRAQALSANKKQRSALFQPLIRHLRRRYGPFWRSKVRLLLVTGEATQIAAIAPGLAAKQWLEGNRTVLIHGGSLASSVDEDSLRALLKLRRRRPLDGIVLALDEAQASPNQLDINLRTLEQVGEALHYQPPVYLWQVRDSLWPQTARITQTVGVLLPAGAVPETVGQQLSAMLPQLNAQGMQQIAEHLQHDYLLRCAQWLKARGIADWQTLLTPWLSRHQQGVPLRGLMFSPTLAAENKASGVDEHRWLAPAPWQGIMDDCARARGVRIGLPWEHSLKVSLLTLLALWGIGSVVAFAVNRQQIIAAAERAQQLGNTTTLDDRQLIALQALRNDIGLLQHQQQHGAPWYQRFGMDHNAPLLMALMPWYGQASNRLIRDAAADSLMQKLTALINLPPRSPLRATLAKPGYDRLKAYLMMAHPDKANAAFFARTLETTALSPSGVSPALWQSIAPDLWAFYMRNLPAQPAWKIEPDTQRVAQARRILLEQIGQRNAESTLYENMLTEVRRNYADMSLEDMTPQTDARRLFSTEDAVPGMFTRQAWEGGIQEAIDKAVASRRDEIDWVLSDSRNTVSNDISPEALKQRLTHRYFADFAGSWLSFLNGIRLNPAYTISDVIDQLSLTGDVRQSPLIALMNTLAYQGQTGQRGEAISDSLVKSAKKLIAKGDLPAIDQQGTAPAGPLESTFGPLLTLMGKNSAQNLMAADNSLSLQTWLTRVTRVRLKLQQVANAADPQAKMQQLAQTVFQGKSVDLTDTQAYGSLVAASLGEEWTRFGETMFVQPLTQAWETVLQPSAASLNDQWQRSIVANWHAAFDGRYPFAGGKNDVSLPMLAEFVRKDSGRIDRFLTTQLGGVLHKEGSRWVADETNSQGLTFSPAFLSAVNQLSQLSDILFTDGSQGIGFEMQGVAMPEIVETQLTLDGQRLHYFNQLPDWQSFRWPGVINKPGAMLTWTSTTAGARLLANYSGAWGAIRLFEQAKREPVGNGLFRLTLTAPDSRQLQWLLRTELGDGPLALLKLRNFALPEAIFNLNAAAYADGYPPAAPHTASEQ